MTADQFDELVGEVCPMDRLSSGRARGRSDRDDLSMGRTAVEVPEITGPETANTAGPAPESRIVPRRNRYYAVEVAIDPSEFDGTRDRDNLSPARLYGSWRDGM